MRVVDLKYIVLAPQKYALIRLNNIFSLLLHMFISTKRAVFLASFFLFIFSASAQKIEKGYEALKVYNYFEAKRIFTKTIKKDSSASAFGLATIYFRNDNPFHSLDSAYKYVLISERNFNLITAEQKAKLLPFGFDYLRIIELRAKVSSAFYELSTKINTIVGYNEFITRNYWSQDRFHAIYKRDSLAFEIAIKINSTSSFQSFMNIYPTSDFTKVAQKEFELCQFKEATQPGTLTSYLTFCRKFPRNRHVKDAEDRIYEISVKNHKIEDYCSFIKNQPLNRNVEEAWRKVYQLFMVDYADDRIQQFQNKYPTYPFQSELEKDIQFSKRQLVPQKQGSLFGFMNYEGETIIDPLYEYVGFFHDGLAMAVKKGKFGYIDKGNNVVVDFIYDSGLDFEEGRAIVGLNDKLGVIDRSGRISMPITYKDLGTFSEGLIYGKVDSLYGYYDNSGFLRIDEKYLEAFSFIKGLAKVILGKNQSFIDAYGSTMVPTTYESIHFFNDSLLVFETYGKFGICRKNGQIIDSAKYDLIGPLTFDRALVSKKGKIGYLNGSGKLILDLKFEEFPNFIEKGQFNDNYAVVKLKGKFGVIDKLGKVIIPTTHSNMGNSSILTAFMKGKLWGFIDNTNTTVIAPQYEYAESFDQGYAFVTNQDLAGMIDAKGKVTVPLSFKEIDRLDINRVIVSTDSLFGVFGVSGEIIVPVEYDQIRILDKDFLILTKSGEVHYLYLPQNRVIKPKDKNE